MVNSDNVSLEVLSISPILILGKLLEGQLKEQLKEHLEGEAGEKIIEGLEQLFK